jgi:aldose sugar dehydrogenase
MRTRSTFSLVVRFFCAGLLAGVLVSNAHAQGVSHSKDVLSAGPPSAVLSVSTLIENLAHPWSMAWLPTGQMLITERTGQLRQVSADFKSATIIKGLPATILAEGQGGLFDVAIHPDYAKNGWIYLSYAERQSERSSAAGTALIRARLKGDQLIDIEPLFSMQPKSRGGRHFGGRIVFDRKGFVYLTLGDRGEEARAQALKDHAGTVIRLHDDGRIPADNPFVSRTEIPHEVFSRGNRNIQGAALHPLTGELWAHEHGPQGGDEVNVIRAGRNYGWPVITYGVNYVIGTRIGEGTQKAGMEQPVHVWVPSIAPSGMAFYTGKAFPQWQSSLLIGALRAQGLIRLELNGERVVREERLLVNQVGRIRDVRVGPDGLIYLLTDSPDGKLLRLEPR